MKKFFGGVIALALLGAASAQAQQNLVKNGNFDLVTNANGVAQTGDNYVVKSTANPGGYNSPSGFNLTDWTNQNYVGVVYGSGLGDNKGVNDPLLDRLGGNITYCPSAAGYRNCNWVLTGPDSGFPQTAIADSSPQGGNYFGGDGGYFPGTLSQTVTGLVPGQAYTLSFWTAGSVLLVGAYNYGSDSSNWTVTLGSGSKLDVNQKVSTPLYPANGFSPWVQTVINFTASSSSEMLSFLAGGTGSPPMSLLDGVAIMPGTNVVPAVPEPEQWAMLGVGLLVVGLRLRKRRAS